MGSEKTLILKRSINSEELTTIARFHYSNIDRDYRIRDNKIWIFIDSFSRDEEHNLTSCAPGVML